MNDMEFKNLMEDIKKSNDAQAKYGKRQYLMSQITAAASIVILGIVLYAAATLLPKLNVTYEHTKIIMADLQTITSELAQSDLDDMLNNIDRLVVSSEGSIHDTMEKIDAIDIESLNKAIKDLSAVVEPLAKFFNVFN